MRNLYILIIISGFLVCNVSFGKEDVIKGAESLDFEYNSIDEVQGAFDNTVNFYESLGKRLYDYQRKTKSLCVEKKLSKEQCDVLKKRYNNLRAKYITSGNLIIDDIENPELKEVNIIKYRRLKKEIMMELDKLETFEGRE